MSFKTWIIRLSTTVFRLIQFFSISHSKLNYELIFCTFVFDVYVQSPSTIAFHNNLSPVGIENVNTIIAFFSAENKWNICSLLSTKQSI